MSRLDEPSITPQWHLRSHFLLICSSYVVSLVPGTVIRGSTGFSAFESLCCRMAFVDSKQSLMVSLFKNRLLLYLPRQPQKPRLAILQEQPRLVPASSHSDMDPDDSLWGLFVLEPLLIHWRSLWLLMLVVTWQIVQETNFCVCLWGFLGWVEVGDLFTLNMGSSIPWPRILDWIKKGKQVEHQLHLSMSWVWMHYHQLPSVPRAMTFQLWQATPFNCEVK